MVKMMSNLKEEPTVMNKKNIVVITSILITAFVAATFFVFNKYNQATIEVAVAKKAVERTEQQMIGYKKYTDYLVQGKESLQQQIKLLTAKVVRNDTRIVHIQRGFGPFESTAEVLINYSAEYSFGYELKPGNYDVRQGRSGIEIVLGRPILVSSPSVLSSNHGIPNSGLLINSKDEVLKLYEQLPAITLAQGTALAATPEVVALCEKSLIGFFRDFLSKQPGVLFVPNIEVVYK